MFISHSLEETITLGRQWGRTAQPGWVIGLSGDLGAGKTQLVKGIAEGLGVTDRVQSPTFALVNEYSGGRLRLFHLDLYRLDTEEQIRASGLEDYLHSPPGVAVVEWIERWMPDPACRTPRGGFYRHVFIQSLGEQVRQIQYEDFGS